MKLWEGRRIIEGDYICVHYMFDSTYVGYAVMMVGGLYDVQW